MEESSSRFFENQVEYINHRGFLEIIFQEHL